MARLIHPDRPGRVRTVPDSMVEHAAHTGWVAEPVVEAAPADPDTNAPDAKPRARKKKED